MESHWQAHGKASSAAQMAYEIRLRFPNKNGNYRDECSQFLHTKMCELKKSKAIQDIPVSKLDYNFESVTECLANILIKPLNEALKGMRYEI